MEKTPYDRRLVDEALRIIELAQEQGMIMRAIGAIAVELHSPKYSYLREEMKRPPHKDIDLITHGRNRKLLKKFFAEIKYRPLTGMAVLYGQTRHTYNHEVNMNEIDVYFDKLDYCHKIDLTERLELDKPTITPADILLQKMQIVVINEKDIIDASILLREHEIGDTDGDAINAKYISHLLSGDWGFYYTFTRNLDNVKSWINKHENVRDEAKNDICAKIEKISRRVADEPKSFRWEARSKVGTKKKWYNDVESLPGRP